MRTDFFEIARFSDVATANRCTRELRESHVQYYLILTPEKTRLLICESDIRRAESVLQSIAGFDAAQNSNRDSPACPRCTAGAVAKEVRRYQILGLSMMLGTTLAFYRERWRCKDCRHLWK